MFAPLEDTSDIALRTLCFNHGADLTFTEMTRVDGLARGNTSTWRKIALNETPTWIQIVGQKEEQLNKFLHELEPSKGFKGINFNLGCPSPAMIRQGLGCAMVKRVTKTKKLLAIVKDHGYASSIKIRLGLNKFEKKKKTYLNLINAVDCEFVIVHCRTGDQHYEQPPDHSVLSECVGTGKSIIANGDITTKETVSILKSVGVDGVMIGRAAVCNPAIFDFLRGKSVSSIEELKREYDALCMKYVSPPKYRRHALQYMGRPVPTSVAAQG